MHPFDMEHVCSYNATLEMEFIGPTPEGFRVNAYITGGEVTGPKLQGKIKPVGADWLTIRSDGVGFLDVRTTIETHDGALIYVCYNGFTDFGETGYQDFLEGKPKTNIQICATPRLTTSNPKYDWVNRLQFVNIGVGDLTKPEVHYDVYAIK